MSDFEQVSTEPEAAAGPISKIKMPPVNLGPLIDRLRVYEVRIDAELSKYPLLVQLEQQTKIPKVYFTLGGGLLIFNMIFFNLGATLVTNAVGWAYPAYASVQAIERETDDTQWLTYWVVFGLFTTIEYFLGIILYWVPFYFIFKTMILLWLFLPNFRGALVLYNSFIRPIFLAQAKLSTNDYTGRVEAALSQASHSIPEALSEAQGTFQGNASE